MPPLPDAPASYRVSCTGVNGAATWANVFHVNDGVGGASVADLNSFASDFANAFDGHLNEHQSDQSLLTAITVTDLTTTSGNVGTWAGSMAGDVSGQQCPAQVAACISWKIAARYRGGKPRTYLAGILEAQRADTTHFTPTAVSNWLSDASGFLAAVNGLSIGSNLVTLGCVSYYTGHALRGTGLFRPFIQVNVNARIDTQRRRLGKL